MLRKETISDELSQYLDSLMTITPLKNHRLVGGTALSLQLGHRKSIDIDLFSDQKSDYPEILKNLQLIFKSNIKQYRTSETGIEMVIGNVKIDIHDWTPKFIRPELLIGNWRLAIKEDIIAMKFQAICDTYTARYEKKDFVDVAALMNEFSLEQMMHFYNEKYPDNKLSERIILERLALISRAENKEMPLMLNGQDWTATKKIIASAIDSYVKNKLLGD